MTWLAVRVRSNIKIGQRGRGPYETISDDVADRISKDGLPGNDWKLILDLPDIKVAQHIDGRTDIMLRKEDHGL